MAVALITTLYGVILAYLFFMPLAGKLKIRSSEEIIIRQVMVEGSFPSRRARTPGLSRRSLSLSSHRPSGKASAGNGGGKGWSKEWDKCLDGRRRTRSSPRDLPLDDHLQ